MRCSELFNRDERKLLYLKKKELYPECMEFIDCMDFTSRKTVWTVSMALNLCYFYGKLDKMKKILEQACETDYQYAQSFRHEVMLLLSPEENRKNELYEIENLRLVTQVGNGCLPASLAMIINYWNHSNSNGRELVKEMHTDLKLEGTSIYEIFPYLNSINYQFYPFTAEDEVIIGLLKENFPLLTIHQSSIHGGGEHARVMIGYDRELGVFWFKDPFEGRMFLKWNIFHELGLERGKNLLVLVAPMEIKIPEWFISYVQINVDYLNLMGVAYDELDQPEISETYFRRGMEIQASYADLLNNYAILLKKDRNRLDEARDLCVKAIKYSCGEKEYLDTLNMISRRQM